MSVIKYFLLLHRFKYLLTVIFSLVFIISACGYSSKATQAIDTTKYIAGTGSTKTLLVMLPGIRGNDKSFAKNDFITILESNDIDVDVLAIDAHFAYYKNKSLIDRLQQDVIKLAKQQGYENIWLLGISLGGLGSMLYTNQRPEDISGVILIAPYLGDKELLDEIKSYANLQEWLEYVKQINRENYKETISEKQRKIAQHLWLPLLQRKCYPQKPIYLLYGEKDKLKYSNDILATCLRKDRIVRMQGKHNWSTWKELWHKLLTNNPGIFSKQ